MQPSGTGDFVAEVDAYGVKAIGNPKEVVATPIGFAEPLQQGSESIKERKREQINQYEIPIIRGVQRGSRGSKKTNKTENPLKNGVSDSQGEFNATSTPKTVPREEPGLKKTQQSHPDKEISAKATSSPKVVED